MRGTKQTDEEGSVETGGTLFLYLCYKADTDRGPWELKDYCEIAY